MTSDYLEIKLNMNLTFYINSTHFGIRIISSLTAKVTLEKQVQKTIDATKG